MATAYLPGPQYIRRRCQFARAAGTRQGSGQFDCLTCQKLDWTRNRRNWRGLKRDFDIFFANGGSTDRLTTLERRGMP